MNEKEKELEVRERQLEKLLHEKIVLEPCVCPSFRLQMLFQLRRRPLV